jgi:hypothetical protein
MKLHHHQRFYCVQADWHGGGFGYTLPFPSKASAHAWAEHKARFHPDAVITVLDRGPCLPEAANDPRGANPLAVDPKIAAADERALREQIRMHGARGWL